MAKSTAPFALVVNDDAFMLMHTADILTEAGFWCHKAPDGDAAIELLSIEAKNIILLFSDVEMPGATDGFALARYVATQYPWIEIVIASSRIKTGASNMPPKATFISKLFDAQLVHDHLGDKLLAGKNPKPLKHPV